MKKKLNFYCLIVLVLLAADFIIAFWVLRSDFMRGWHDGANATLSTSGEIYEQTWYVLLTSVLVFVFGIRALVSFIRFIINVNRSQVFTWSNVRHLRWVSIGIMVVVVLMMINNILMHKDVMNVLSDNLESIIFCVFTLIIAEAFALGIKLREEQELTI